jgi:hypothetical protein
MTQRKPLWVKWFPRDFLEGISFQMDAATIGVYTVVLNLIYDHGGPIKDDVPFLSRRLMMRPTSLEKCLVKLAQLGKLIRVDGVISNPRAEIEIEHREEHLKKLRESRGNLGEKSDKTPKKLPEKVNKINETTSLDIDNRIRKDRTPLPPQGVAAAPRPPRPASAGPRSDRLDRNRKPSNENLVYGRSRGLTARETQNEWEKFVRYYAGLDQKHRAAKSPDWDAVWESWVLRAAERLGREPFTEEVATKPSVYPLDVWRRSMEMYHSTGTWHPDLGPNPDEPGFKPPVGLVIPG